MSCAILDQLSELYPLGMSMALLLEQLLFVTVVVGQAKTIFGWCACFLPIFFLNSFELNIPFPDIGVPECLYQYSYIFFKCLQFWKGLT